MASNETTTLSTQQTTEKTPSIITPQAKRALPLGGLALLLSVLLAVVFGLFYWQANQALSQLADKVTNLTQQNQQANTQLSSSIAELQGQMQQQQTIVGNIQQASNGGFPSWRFAEVKYLVQLANYQLLFMRDLAAAITLLQTADQRLAAIGDPTLMPLRQQIANAVAALQAVPKIDLAGLLTRITALQTQVAQLPTIGLPTTSATQTQQTSQAASPLRKALNDSWDTLQKIIIIRRHDQPIEPLLSPEQQLYLQQNLQLILQQAQWAALRGDEQVYQSSLQQAQAWVQHYFVKNLPPTIAFSQALNELLKINVQPKLPDLSPLVQLVLRTHLTSLLTPPKKEA
jgi:uroporphyrin-3 C-methyltransferase